MNAATDTTPAPAQRSIDVLTPDGHRAELKLFLPPQPRAVLLWASAMGVPARKYAPLASALAAQGVAVALHEWRGGGTSNQRASRRCDWNYSTLLDDLDASRDALDAALPGVPCLIGGHSLGAQLGLLALARAPQAYAGGAIVASGHPWWRGFPGWQRPFLFGIVGWFRLLGALCGHFPGERAGFAGREARSVIRDWTQTVLRGRYELPGLDIEARLRAVTAPVFGAHFAHDRYVPARSLDLLLARFERAPLQRVEFRPDDFPNRRADHFSWMREPGPVAAALAQWIDEALPQRT